MWMSRMISISKATNGYVLECTVPLKPEAKSTAKMDSCCCSPCGSSSADKQYIAKDSKEVSDLVEDIMPLLDGEYKTESDFDKAFEAATSMANSEEKGEQ